MNRLRDQGRDYEKIVFMFISGRMFLVVIDNNHVQRVFTSRHFYLILPVWHLNYLMLSEDRVCSPNPACNALPAAMASRQLRGSPYC